MRVGTNRVAAAKRGTWRGLPQFIILCLPILVLFAYGIPSLILFHNSATYRGFVSVFPERLPWLLDLFPILQKLADNLAARPSSYSLGYFYHLYFIALAATALCVIGHVLAFGPIHRGFVAGLRSDVRLRKRFDDPADAILKIALIVGCGAVILAALCHGWLWDVKSWRKAYYWNSGFFPVLILPLFFGALPTAMLIGLRLMFAAASTEAKKMPWGIDAVREEAALKASGKNPDPF